ncbi:MAG: ribonuclease J [Acutalibacteraceae bacterium]
MANNKRQNNPSAAPAKGRTGTEKSTGKPSRRGNRARGEKPAKNTADKAPKAPQKATRPAPANRQQTGQKPRAAAPGNRSRRSRKGSPVTPVRLTMLGGMNEIGKNITLLEYGDDAILIDCGMAFPDDNMLGVDIVLPDFSHLEKVADKVRGVVLTHGHEDHIGALPYLIKQFDFPIFGTRLTLALVENKLKEHNLTKKARLNVVQAGSTIQLGKLSVEFVNVNHSIPDAVALAIKTPLGYVVHTGDFKIDCTPISGDVIDLARFGELGKEGVLALLAESTNVERPGFTPSERIVGKSFENLFHNAVGKRLIIATFSSNLYRVQQIMDAAQRDGRKVAFSGRSMINNVQIATELGYLRTPKGLLIDLDDIDRYPKDQVTLITTGSQGEPMSALTRMAFSDHRKVEVGPDDYIIISATPIPGNEKAVGKVVNELMKRGCDVVYERMYDVHVSGHACQEELKIMHTLVRPKFFLPVHGEQKHLQKHAELARSLGMDPSHILIGDIGKVIEITPDKMEVVGQVQAGQVLVDGLGVGDVGSIVLRDRRHLAEDGLIVVVATMDPLTGRIVSGPDIVSRGFVYVRESEELIEQAKDVARRALEDCVRSHAHDWNTLKTRLRDDLSRMIFQKTKRTPMILPIIMDA